MSDRRVSSSSIQHVVSSGGVIYRVVDGVVEVALIRVGGSWCLPKGLIEEGESFEAAASREALEETGLNVELIEKIGEIGYGFYRERCYFKTVHFFLFKCIGGSIDKHDREVDCAKWFPLEEAKKALTYPNERRILTEARNIINR